MFCTEIPEPLLVTQVYQLGNDMKLVTVEDVVPCSPEQFDELWAQKTATRRTGTFYGKICEIPRFEKLYGRDGVGLPYSGGEIIAETVFPKIVQQSLEAVRELYFDDDYFEVLVCFFAGQVKGDSIRDRVGAHRDNESVLISGSPIAGITFLENPDEPRKLRIRCYNTKKIVLDLFPKHSSLYSMEGSLFQQLLTHEIVGTSKPIGRRISLTFRKMKR